MRSEMQAEITSGITSNDKVAANSKQFEHTESNLFADAYADLSVAQAKTVSSGSSVEALPSQSSTERRAKTSIANTADSSSLDRCDLGLAEVAAKALDDKSRADASRLLRGCLDQSAGIFSVSPDYQKFAEAVSALEVKGKGLDLTLKYGLGRRMAFYFESAEIK